MEKFIIWAILIIMAGFGYVEGVTYLSSECSQADRNSTVNTVYRENLRNLLGSLVNNAPLQNGYFNNSVGNGSNQVYGLAWCRGDVSPQTCSKCLTESIDIPLTECPDIKDMAIWTSFCNLRFSNESFFGKEWNSSDSFATYGSNGLDNPSVFSQGFSMMETLARNASNQPLKFEMGVISVGGNRERFGLAQCSRDLRQSDCENCLEDLLMTYKTYVLNRTGWEMQSVSCGMWYYDVPIYHDSGMAQAPNTSGGGEIWHKGDVILALVAFLVFYLIP
ncbi:gnk2-like domain-containing protein [Artemisia annua]|uniref:Gnk2-like domain-containing protein n=1 Tax=Artemisia annua TaxID=35608 RepID=A0A2U1KAT0_ARTAN|nr:gnk2-like domain-containing protein [Artemisia annua]